tara:strand:- start:66224 stop:66586 length:363 start_codon:yes stop_codon:yes gene_type:complete
MTTAEEPLNDALKHWNKKLPRNESPDLYSESVNEDLMVFDQDGWTQTNIGRKYKLSKIDQYKIMIHAAIARYFDSNRDFCINRSHAQSMYENLRCNPWGTSFSEICDEVAKDFDLDLVKI